MDELAKLYFQLDGATYRVKVFENTVWIEQQPGGMNQPFERQQWPTVWNEPTNAWNINDLVALVGAYKRR